MYTMHLPLLYSWSSCHSLSNVLYYYVGLGDSYGSILYDNYIFDTASILDLASLYSTSKETLLLTQSMLTSVVCSIQPLYIHDICSSISITRKVLQEITDRVMNISGSENSEVDLAMMDSSFLLLLDLYIYLIDVMYSTEAMLKVLFISGDNNTMLISVLMNDYKDDWYAMVDCLFHAYNIILPILERSTSKASKL